MKMINCFGQIIVVSSLILYLFGKKFFIFYFYNMGINFRASHEIYDQYIYIYRDREREREREREMSSSYTWCNFIKPTTHTNEISEGREKPSAFKKNNLEEERIKDN